MLAQRQPQCTLNLYEGYENKEEKQLPLIYYTSFKAFPLFIYNGMNRDFVKKLQTNGTF